MGHSQNLHALAGWAEVPGTFQDMRLLETLRGSAGTGVGGAGLHPALGLAPPRLPEHAAAAGAPSWGGLSHSAHARPSGVTQPCSPHSSSATQPVGPPQLETGPVLGVVRSNHSEAPRRPLGPRQSSLLSLLLSLIFSATVNPCLPLLLPQSSSGTVPAYFCFSLSRAGP